MYTDYLQCEDVYVFQEDQNSVGLRVSSYTCKYSQGFMIYISITNQKVSCKSTQQWLQFKVSMSKLSFKLLVGHLLANNFRLACW